MRFINNHFLAFSILLWNLLSCSSKTEVIGSEAQNSLEESTMEDSLTYLNYQLCNIGDTIKIIAPIQENEEGIKTTFYYGGYVNDSIYYRGYDTLAFSGVVLDVFFDDSYDKSIIDSSDLVFQLKLTRISKDSIMIYNRNVIQGDTIIFSASSYARKIEKSD